MPRPPPSSQLTSERSSTIIRASSSDVTARRRMKADSLRTILPVHSTIPSCPILSMLTSNISPSSKPSSILPCTSVAIRSKQYLHRLARQNSGSTGTFGRLSGKSVLQKQLYSPDEIVLAKNKELSIGVCSPPARTVKGGSLYESWLKSCGAGETAMNDFHV